MEVLATVLYTALVAPLAVGAIVALETGKPRIVAAVSLLVALVAAVVGGALHVSALLSPPWLLPALPVVFTGAPLLFLLVAITGSLVIVAEAPFAGSDSTEYALLLAMATGLAGLFTTTSLFWLVIYWETVVLPLFYAAWRRGARRGALYFLAYNQVSGLLLVAGASLLYAGTGSWSISSINMLGGLWRAVFTALIILAAMIKAPVFPLHSWLPVLYGEAPSTVSASSVILTKMSLYLLALLALSGSGPRAPLLALLALIGSVYALLAAHREIGRDAYRRVAGYTSMAHMGLVMAALLASGETPAVEAALLFTVAHTFSLIPLLAASEAAENMLGGDLLAAAAALTMPLPGLATFAAELAALYALYSAAQWPLLLLGLGLLASILGVSASSWILYRGLPLGRGGAKELGQIVLAIAVSAAILVVVGIMPHVVEALI